MYWLILRWPLAPSLLIFSSAGTALASRLKMMLAEMYGITPSENNVALPSEPPVSTFIMPNSRPTPSMLPRLASMTSALTPGSGMKNPMR